MTDNSERDDRGPAIIVAGDVVGGFVFVGPFDTVDEAVEHQKKTVAGQLGAPARIVILKQPTSDPTLSV